MRSGKTKRGYIRVSTDGVRVCDGTSWVRVGSLLAKFIWPR